MIADCCRHREMVGMIIGGDICIEVSESMGRISPCDSVWRDPHLLGTLVLPYHIKL